jgi:hypothetical protein
LQEKVGLKFQATGISSGKNDRSYFKHCFINLRVVIEEFLSGLEISNTLVHVQLMQKFTERFEADIS